MRAPSATDVDVLVVGAGPTGLVAAIDALRHGLSVRIIDQNAERSPHSRALVVHSRSLEVLDDLGCADAVLQAGREFRALNVLAPDRPVARIEFRSLEWNDAPYPMWLTIPQSETERCLEERLNALGANVERRTALRSFVQDQDGVDAELAGPDGSTLACRAAWLVGADGARSEVRRAAEIELEGAASGEVFVLADVAMESTLVDAEGYNVLAREGVLLIVPMQAPGVVRLIAHLPSARPDEPVDIDLPMLQRLVDTRTGLPSALSSLGWTSFFSPKHFIASSLRRGRAILAGDAAHIHSPVGGQGLNTGIQDAYNLMWKLALVQRGLAAPELIDTYHQERHPVGERMIRGVRRATLGLTLRAGPAQALRNRVARLLFGFARVRDRMGAQLGMLELRYGPSLAAASSARGRPEPGERAPQIASSAELTRRLRGAHHTLLLFDGGPERLTERDRLAASELAKRLAGDAVEVVSVRREPATDETCLADPDGVVHRAFGAKGPLAVWIRPDKYVGFRGDPRALDGLRSYLQGLFAAKPDGKLMNDRWSRPIVTLHWISAVLVVSLIAGGFVMGDLAAEEPLRRVIGRGHTIGAVALAVLTLVRLVLRRVGRRPTPIPFSAWHRRGVVLVHGLIYAAIFAMVASGLTMAAKSTWHAYLRGEEAAAPVLDALLARQVHGAIALTLLLLVLAHVGGVLVRQLKEGGVLRRMLPFLR